MFHVVKIPIERMNKRTFITPNFSCMFKYQFQIIGTLFRYCWCPRPNSNGNLLVNFSKKNILEISRRMKARFVFIYVFELWTISKFEELRLSIFIIYAKKLFSSKTSVKFIFCTIEIGHSNYIFRVWISAWCDLTKINGFIIDLIIDENECSPAVLGYSLISNKW